ncbi:hypothetical protein [Mycoplasma suis]|uniref:Uncharacterized protein n=1 Tax=Mycoplasma suis (strain Illinois) TaxID=768700 RepID=F0QQI5_MYCSL|nr:hypothetical protein [Mycoplasma suis]ADX97755.1 hypothetical protein MSU_0211 [Mycoplasma suis str. Illinois]
MPIKTIGGYGWTLVAGAFSAVAAGGYGAVSLLGKDKVLDYASFDFDNTSKKVNPNITYGEYITKDHVSKGEIKGICKEWKQGRITRLEKESCEKKIQEKWSGSVENQPEVWFSSNLSSIVEVLKEHFNEKDQFQESMFSVDTEWEIGDLACKPKQSFGEEAIEVSCHFKKDKEVFISN